MIINVIDGITETTDLNEIMTFNAVVSSRALR